MGERDTIYKICDRDEWDAALQTGSYRGSADDIRDGFIHFSHAHQVAGTLAKYFVGRTDLVLIAVAAGALGASLRHEASRGGDLFPHLYGELPTACAQSVRSLAWNGQQHLLPADL